MIYLDPKPIPHKGKVRYHMTADSIQELHLFAASIGVARCWFDKPLKHPHYDITAQQKASAMVKGAIEIGRKDFVRKCWAIAKQPRSGNRSPSEQLG